MKIKYISAGLVAVTTIALAATVSVDTVSDTLENAPNCATGIKKLANDSGIKQYFPSGVFTDGNFYGCFANPKQFQVKIYKIALLDANGNESVLYEPGSPQYVDIINNRFNPVRDVSSNLTNGTTYTKVKLVVDSNYKFKLDEQIATYGGNTSRVISYDAGLTPYYSGWVTPLTNSGVTGDGSGNARQYFRRDASAPADLITFFHNGFLASSSNMTLSNVGYVMTITGFGNVQKNFSTGCYFGGNPVQTFCTPAEIASLNRVTTGTGTYPLQADWTINSSQSSISAIKHEINLDRNGNALDYFSMTDENNSTSRTPSIAAGRATITLSLKTPFTYDSSKGTVMHWKWLTKNLLFLGMYAPYFDNSTRNSIDFFGLGPYTLDLSIKSVQRKSSGLTDTTPIASSSN